MTSLSTFLISIEESMETRTGAFFFLVVFPLWIAVIGYVCVS